MWRRHNVLPPSFATPSAVWIHRHQSLPRPEMGEDEVVENIRHTNDPSSEMNTFLFLFSRKNEPNVGEKNCSNIFNTVIISFFVYQQKSCDSRQSKWEYVHSGTKINSNYSNKSHFAQYPSLHYLRSRWRRVLAISRSSIYELINGMKNAHCVIIDENHYGGMFLRAFWSDAMLRLEITY